MAGHGGARPGAGRKPKSEKYAGQIAALDDRFADRLQRFADNIEQLADGGNEVVEEEYKPAGLIFVGSGEWATLAFPHLDPAELVCVRRVRRTAAPDLKANMYGIDRILGKPTQRAELTGEDGAPLGLPSDDERLARITELLERGRARRAGLAPDGESGELP